MLTLADARVLNVRETRWEGPREDAEDIAENVRKVRDAIAGKVIYVTVSSTAAFTQRTHLSTWGGHEVRALAHPDDDHLRSWQRLADLQAGNGGSVESSTRATNPTSTTVSSIRRLLRRQLRDQRLASLPPERRSLYESITSLRDSVGQVDFDIIESLRELRSNG